MTVLKIDPARTAFLIVDMQNDFLHADGAYGRAGQSSGAIAALVDRHARVASAIRASGAWIVSTQFTLVPGKAGAPFIAPHLAKLRPFLTKGDFAPGSWGHALIDQLAPAELTVEKVAYSAFYQSRLDFVLRKAGIETLLVGGIVTNGGVESTVRDAHVREYRVVVLEDGCAAFSEEAHRAALASMATLGPLASCASIIDALQAAS